MFVPDRNRWKETSRSCSPKETHAARGFARTSDSLLPAGDFPLPRQTICKQTIAPPPQTKIHKIFYVPGNMLQLHSPSTQSILDDGGRNDAFKENCLKCANLCRWERGPCSMLFECSMPMPMRHAVCCRNIFKP